MKTRTLHILFLSCIMVLSIFVFCSCKQCNLSTKLPLRTTQDGLVFVLLPNNTYEVRDFDNLTSVVSIPETINGAKVTSVGDCAFKDCDSLTNIEIPKSITNFNSEAFSGCSSLEKVDFLGTIEEWVKINFYGVLANPICYANDLFIKNELLTQVKINTATSISDYVLCGCTSLIKVTIGDSVQSIGNSAFENCSSLESLKLGNNVTSIGNRAFSDCTSLTEINYNSIECEDLSSDNGVFSCAGQNGEGIRIIIGSKVKKIPSHLFNPYFSVYPNYSPIIANVVFEEDSVCESIGSYAFSFNSNSPLMVIEIPRSVTKIGHFAFDDCAVIFR